MASPRLILASASPRRADFLDLFDLEYEVRPADIDESPEAAETAAIYVERLAREKALHQIAERECVIAADTIVVLDGELLGKPRDRREAEQMIARLAGRDHEVLTGVAVAYALDEASPPRCAARVESSRVTFRSLEAERCKWYASTGEGLDKAGAYAIQGRAALFVERIEGSFSNIIGLPVHRMDDCLRELGLDLLALPRRLS